jgi:signal peptidase I
MNKERVKSEAREWIESLIIALVIALFIRTFVIQAFKIPSGSMIPTFNIGDRIFVNKYVYGAKVPLAGLRLPAVKQPQHGDIVVFISPEDKKKDFVKRLIAVGGETVEIKEGRIYIDGRVVDEPASIRSVYYLNGGDYGREGQALTVPKDSYFMLGDNSAHSRDSRYWGFVPKKNVLGKVILIHWPLNRMKFVK